MIHLIIFIDKNRALLWPISIFLSDPNFWTVVYVGDVFREKLQILPTSVSVYYFKNIPFHLSTAKKQLSLSLSLYLSKHPGEPLWYPGSRVAVPGGGGVPAGAPGGAAADGLRRLAAPPGHQHRLLHVPPPGHRTQLWRLLCVPAAAHAGMHGVLRSG